ncbi:Solute carrier family 2, facilitated glucose transporter member 1 [Aphelenchoides bicaudatus]|nr:Solute carrier family 2, facilitated glucose transporter member 1 [Aphelenchoides bicaudatus]
MIDRYHAIRLFVICGILSFITNFPAAVPTSSLNTALDEFRGFIHNSFRDRGFDFSNETELIIRTIILNSWYLAQFIGAMTLFPLAEVYGRLGAFKISVAGMGIGNLLQFVASFTALPELFLCGRFLAGILSPLCDTCMIMYFQECTPVHFRGVFSYLGSIGYGSLSALGMLLGNSFMLGDSFVWLTGVQVPPVFASLLFICLFLHESPKYLAIVKKDNKAAMESLIYFQGKKEENAELIQNYDQESDHLVHKHAANLKELFKAPHLRFTILITLVLFVLTLPFYAVLQASTFMLEKIGFEIETAEISSMILFIVYTMSCIAVDFMGWLKFVSFIMLVFFIITFGMVLSPIAWFISSELSVQRYRSVVYCICFSLLNILITLTNSVCMLAFKQIGATSFVPLFIVPGLFAILFLWKYLPETRDIESYQVAEVIKLMTKHKVGVKRAQQLYTEQHPGSHAF